MKVRAVMCIVIQRADKLPFKFHWQMISSDDFSPYSFESDSFFTLISSHSPENI